MEKAVGRKFMRIMWITLFTIVHIFDK